MNGAHSEEYDAFVIFDHRNGEAQPWDRLICRVHCVEDAEGHVTALSVQEGREAARDVPPDDADGERWLDVLRVLQALLVPAPLAWGDM